jgi:transcriptional regulator with XRE-family HTH domain
MAVAKKNPNQNLNDAQKQLIQSKMTKYRLAKVAGIDHNTVTSLFNGGKNASRETLEKVAKAMNMDLGQFLSIK